MLAIAGLARCQIAMKLQAAIDAVNDLDANVVVLSKLHRILADPNSDLDSVSELIITDGPLSASVLRMSNGAFYGASEPVDSIAGAIYKIGFREIIRLVSAFISRKVFLQDLMHYRMSARAYWTYSYFCASLMEWLVRERADRVLAYLYGLFHAIGRIGLEKVLQGEGSDRTWDRATPLELWETQVFGFTACEVGAQALASWEFDSLLCKLIETQLDASSSPYPHLNHALQAARKIAEHNHCDMSLESWALPEIEPTLKALKVDAETLQNFVNAAFQSVKSMHIQIGRS